MTPESIESEARVDNAEVAFHPPLLLLGSLIVGFIARWLVPAEFLPRLPSLVVGPVLVAVSLGLFAWTALTMQRGDASIPTNEPTNAVVTKGPFAFSRNPIYLSMVLLLISVGIWANSLWFPGLAVVMVVLLDWGVISREERYLERKFGDEYLDYKRRVRRWC